MRERREVGVDGGAGRDPDSRYHVENYGNTSQPLGRGGFHIYSQDTTWSTSYMIYMC